MIILQLTGSYKLFFTFLYLVLCFHFQRLGENRNPPQQAEPIISQPVDEPKPTPLEPPQVIVEEKEKVPLKTDKKIEPKPVEKEPIKESKDKNVLDETTDNNTDIKQITISDDEESLTPPLLPSMKVINKETSNTNDGEKKNEKDKNRKSEWDMFADQDIFKSSTSVSIVVHLSIANFCHQI